METIGDQNLKPEAAPIKGATSPLRWLPVAASLLLAIFMGYQWYTANQRNSENEAKIAEMQSRLNDCDTQTKVLQSLIDETGVTRFIARHIAHQLLDVGVFNISKNFVVQDATRKLGGQRGN